MKIFKRCMKGLLIILWIGIFLSPRISFAESLEIASLSDLGGGITLHPPTVVYKEKDSPPWGTWLLMAGFVAMIIGQDPDRSQSGTLVVTVPAP